MSVPALPGSHSQGDPLDEALANIREAADLWFEVTADRATREAQVAEPDAELTEDDL